MLKNAPRTKFIKARDVRKKTVRTKFKGFKAKNF